MLFNIWCSFHFSYSRNLWNKAFSTTVQNTGINNKKKPTIWFNLHYTTNFFLPCFVSVSFTLVNVQLTQPPFVQYSTANIQLYLSVPFCQVAPKTFTCTVTVAECIAFKIINSGSNIHKEFQSFCRESCPEVITTMLNEARLFLIVSQFISFSGLKNFPKLMMTE